MLQHPVVIIGVGELGSVFARGLLRSGHPVYPLGRGTDLTQAAAAISAPLLVLVAVGEDDLPAVLAEIPPAWRDRLCLLQNELLPRDWQAHALTDPTVIAVWFEKKKGMDSKVLLPSPLHGPRAGTLEAALAAVAIPARVLASRGELLYELVRKNVYILTINIAGLITGGTVNALWRDHQSLARAIADDVIRIQAYLTGEELSDARLMDGMLEAFAADPDHKCLGRTALSRLQRALTHADAAGLAVPTLRDIRRRCQ